MSKRSIKEEKRALDSLVNNPVALTILGLGKENSGSRIYFSADMNKIYRVFQNLKKDFPKIFENVKFDSCCYSSEVQRGIDLFIGKGIISRGFDNFERYCLDKKRIYPLYQNLSRDKKPVADELGRRFYNALDIE